VIWLCHATQWDGKSVDTYTGLCKTHNRLIGVLALTVNLKHHHSGHGIADRVKTLLVFISLFLSLAITGSSIYRMTWLKTRFHEMYAGFTDLGADCRMAYFNLDYAKELSPSVPTTLTFRSTTLPYRRVDSFYNSITDAAQFNTVRVECNLKTDGLTPNAEVFIDWGRFIGDVVFDVDGQTFDRFHYQTLSHAAHVIPRHLVKKDMKVGFTARREPDQKKLPGTPTLLMIAATQDLKKFQELNVVFQRNFMFNEAFVLGTCAAILVMLLVMYLSKMRYDDVFWMTICLTATAVGSFVMSHDDVSGMAWFSTFTDILYYLSIAALFMAIFSFARVRDRYQWFPKVSATCFGILLLLQYFLGFRPMRLNYISAVLFVFCSIAGWIVYRSGVEEATFRSRRKYGFGLFVCFASAINVPFELFSRYTAIYWGDLIVLMMSWGMAALVAADGVRNLLRYRQNVDLLRAETERRVLMEKNLEMSLAMHGLSEATYLHGPDIPSFLSVSRTRRLAMVGDWIASIELKNHCVLVLAGDVLGSGAGASIAASAIMGFLAGSNGRFASAEEAIRSLNAVVKSMFRDQVMSTFVAVAYDEKSAFTIYNGSYAGVLISRGQGSVEVLMGTLPPLGALDDEIAPTAELVIHPDDSVILLNSGSSKGLRAMRNLSQFVAELSSKVADPKEFAATMCQELESRDPQDEHVVVCIRKAS
jgi:hypothetical protein